MQKLSQLMLFARINKNLSSSKKNEEHPGGSRMQVLACRGLPNVPKFFIYFFDIPTNTK
jgi:hypothetical protein